MTKKDHKFKKGQSGNPNGRPKGCKSKYSISDLRQAIENVEKREKINIFEHFVEQALVDNKVLIALMKKIFPDVVYREPREDNSNLIAERLEFNGMSRKGNGQYSRFYN